MAWSPRGLAIEALSLRNFNSGFRLPRVVDLIYLSPRQRESEKRGQA